MKELIYDESFYTPQIIAEILRAHGLPAVPDVKSPHDSTGEFLLTAYPPQDLTETLFLQDLLLDWQLRQGRLENRRVGFLLNVPLPPPQHLQYASLIIQYSNPDLQLTTNLWKKNSDLATANLQKLLASQVAKNVSQFYGQMKLTIQRKFSHQAILEPQMKRALSKIVRVSGRIEMSGSPYSEQYGSAEFSMIVVDDLLFLLPQYEKKSDWSNWTAEAHGKQGKPMILTTWDLQKKESEDKLNKILPNSRQEQKNPPVELSSAAEAHLLFEQSQEAPEVNLQTGFVSASRISVRKQRSINFPKIKDKIKKEQSNIDQFLQREVKKSQNVNLLQNFNNRLARFLDYYSDCLDLTAQRGALRQREINNEIDEEQKFLFSNIDTSIRFISNIIEKWQQIITEVNQKFQLTLLESKNYDKATLNMIQLLDFNHILIYRLEYYVPIVINLEYLNRHFSFVLTLVETHTRILNTFDDAKKSSIPLNEIHFDPLLGLLTQRREVSLPEGKEIYRKKHQKYLLELKKIDTEKFQNVCQLKYKYFNKESKNNYSTISEDIATATQIHPYLSFPIINSHLRHLTGVIQDQYQHSIKDSNLGENQVLMNDFFDKINYFVQWGSLMLNDFPRSLNNEDHSFLNSFNKIIWMDFNLNEIIVSLQKMFWVLGLFIQQMLDLPEQLSLSIALQKQQIELIKIQRPILLFMNEPRNLRYLTKWCFLENGNITTLDITDANQKAKKSVQSAELKLVDGFIGFKIDSILSIHDQLVDSLSGNCVVRSFQFPQPTSYAEILADANMRELFDIEEKEQKQKEQQQVEAKKKSSSVQTTRIISQPEKLESKPKEQKNSELVVCETRQKFSMIQKKFWSITEKELKQQLLPLLMECKESGLKSEMWNLYSDYFLVISKRLSERDLLNAEVIDLLDDALTSKKNALREFKTLPENDLTVTHRSFFDDNITLIETLLSDIQDAQKKAVAEAVARQKYLSKHREEAKNSMGDFWFANPNPKNENKKLEEEIMTLTQLGAKISKTETSYRSIPHSSQPRENKHRLEQKIEKKAEQKLLPDSELDAKIKDGIQEFKLFMGKTIRNFMKKNDIQKEIPAFFFPEELLYAAVKFMSLMKLSVKNDCEIYGVGGLIINLAQPESIGEQEFNFIDVDIITKSNYFEAFKLLAKNYGIDFQITYKSLSFTSVKFRFANTNFDVKFTKKLDLFEDHTLRITNIGALYLGIDNDLRPIIIDHDKLFFNFIESQLLGISNPGLIKAAIGHFKNQPITKVMPEYKKLCSLLDGAESQPATLVDLEHTLKCFINDPGRLMTIGLMLRKGLIKFCDLDRAMQLLFTDYSAENLFLPMIIEAYALEKSSMSNYADIFHRNILYLFKKAAQSLDCMANPDVVYRTKLADLFPRMMLWCLTEKRFLRIFTLPIKMKVIVPEDIKTIDKACRNLFCHNLFKAPIYKLLLTSFIELHTTGSSTYTDLNVKMLPFVLSLVITAQGLAAGCHVDQLITDIAKIITKVPALNQLYLGLSSQRIPSSFKNYLVTFINTVNKKPLEFEVKEEKSKSRGLGSKIEISPHISQTLIPPSPPVKADRHQPTGSVSQQLS